MKYLLKFLFSVIPIMGYAGNIHHNSNFNMDALKVNIVETKEANHTEVYLDGLANDALVGSPILPTLYVSYALPLHACNVRIGNLELSESERIELDQRILIQPAPSIAIEMATDPYGYSQNQNLKANVIEDVYTPLLEENKEWMYNEVRWDQNNFKEGYTQIFRLGEPEIINEKEYYPLYITRTAENEVETIKGAYLAEDIENRTVNCIFIQKDTYPNSEGFLYSYIGSLFDNENEEWILYNFNDLDNCLITETMLKHDDLECMEYNGHKLESVYYGYEGNLHEDVIFGFIEGIGIVSLPPKMSLDNSSTLLGHQTYNLAGYPIWETYPHLYEVIDGEGNQIYYDIDYAPGFSGINDAIIDKRWHIDMDNEDYQVRIYGVTGEVSLYDTTGKVVLSGGITPDNSSLSLRGVTPGIYIMKIQDHVKKILIK